MSKSVQASSQLIDKRQLVDNPEWVKKLLAATNTPYEKMDQNHHITGSLIVVGLLSIFSFLMGYL